MNSKEQKLEAFSKLLDIMDDLREKCPWDKQQDLQSLRHLTLEEVYELSDALLEENLTEIKKELGDVLLHLVFYAKIGSEKKSFDIADVINSLNEKLIFRHPHIYGNVEVKDEEEVKRNWQKIKSNEGKIDKSILEGVPKSLPAIVKAARIQEKAKQVGFEWENKEQVWEKVEEEIAEMKVEIEANNQLKMEQEFGDVLFSMINYARFLNISPENALAQTNQKFIKRFQQMEQLLAKDGLLAQDQSLAQLDLYWEQAKKSEK